MYDKELETLISAALADGVLTEKEKQVLFRKAQSMGIDLDEFEIVLNARLLQVQKEEKEKASKTAPKSTKLGEVRKCPQCGAVIGSFQMVCPECGFEFSGVGPNAFVDKFTAELRRALEAETGGKGSVFEHLDTTGETANQRREKAREKTEKLFVKNYPLPMTKEDCVEMLNFILPKTGLSDSNSTTRAWRNKYFTILDKLEKENPGNQGIQNLVDSYKSQAKISIFSKLLIWYKSLSKMTRSMIWLVLFYVVFFGILGSVFSDVFDSTDNIDAVQELVDSGDLDGAKKAIQKGSNSLPLYEYYMTNKMWEEAEEFIPKKYSGIDNNEYFEYCKKAVTSMCADGQFEEAKKFIKRKVVFYEKYNNESEYYHKEWNTDIVSKKLNAIIENY